VVLLLQHGASPDATTKDLYTALHIASKEGHEDVVAVLLDHGSNHLLTTKVRYLAVPGYTAITPTQCIDTTAIARSWVQLTVVSLVHTVTMRLAWMGDCFFSLSSSGWFRSLG